MTSTLVSAPPSSLRDIGLHEEITAVETLPGQEQSERLYPIDKLDAHLRNVQHIAISVFVFHGDKLLLQQRAATKYHSAGLWANTVCSHPRWKEGAIGCAHRRLEEELGWNVSLSEFGRIDYKAQVGELFENEKVHCFFGRFDENIDLDAFNTLEVSAVKWMSIPHILEDIQAKPDLYTEWFKIYMSTYCEMIMALVDHQ